MPHFTISSYGPLAWLITSKDHEWLRGISQSCETQAWEYLQEWVMGYETLLLIFKKAILEESLRERLNGISFDPIYDPKETSLHQIKVRYDGPDLADVARQIDTTPEEVIRLHLTPTYTVRFLGFAPGFAYLDGLDPRLILPRRAVPRLKMAPGALAIGGLHTAVYPASSPGGWNWLGHTDHLLFDPDQEIFTLRPGDSVRFHTDSCQQT